MEAIDLDFSCYSDLEIQLSARRLNDRSRLLRMHGQTLSDREQALLNAYRAELAHRGTHGIAA